ncbi:MAG: ABC transporter permease [Gemmatimonadaceae bacterium]|nr:ABC transporter permease [Gemmatimonadaceae bacterium]
MGLARRLRMIASWAFQALAFHRTRTLLTIAAVGLATALVASILGFQAGYRQSLDHNIDSMGYQILVTGKGCPHEAATLILRGGSIPMYIREEVFRHIVEQPEVKDATRFFMQAVPDRGGSSHQLHVGIDESFLALKPGVGFQRGEWFSGALADEAILGFNVAEYLRLGIGDTIGVKGRSFSVRGILDKLGTQDDGTVFLPLEVSQDLFERRDRLTGIGIRLHDMSDAGPFIDRLYDIPSLQVVRMSQVQGTILNILRGVRALLLAFGAVCLVAALMGVFSVALITVNERIPEMGVLRALGYPGWTLFQLVWAESLFLSLAGVIVGAGLTLALRGAAEWAVRSTLTFVPAGTVVAVTPETVLGSGAAVVGLCLAAGVYPALKSSLVSPLTSTRGGA